MPNVRQVCAAHGGAGREHTESTDNSWPTSLPHTHAEHPQPTKLYLDEGPFLDRDMEEPRANVSTVGPWSHVPHQHMFSHLPTVLAPLVQGVVPCPPLRLATRPVRHWRALTTTRPTRPGIASSQSRFYNSRRKCFRGLRFGASCAMRCFVYFWRSENVSEHVARWVVVFGLRGQKNISIET